MSTDAANLMTLPDGQQVRLGLNLPAVRTTSLPSFADHEQILSDEEIRQIVNAPNRVRSRQRFPQSVWSFNQGGLGSCNGWAAARALAKARVLRGLDPVHLSGTFVYAHINLDQRGRSQDQGSTLEDGMRFITDVGACEKSLFPVEEYRIERVSAEAKANAAKYRARECYSLESRQELYSAAALGFLVVVAVHVPKGSSFMQVDSRGRVTQSHGQGNHSVHCDDIVEIDGKFYLDMDYDWGISVGVQGKGFISWENHLTQTVRYHHFYAIRTTSDGE
jgi:hypothetical protein